MIHFWRNFLYAMATGRSMLIMRHVSAQWTKLLRFMKELFKELLTLWTCGCTIVSLLLALMETLTLSEGNSFVTTLSIKLYVVNLGNMVLK